MKSLHNLIRMFTHHPNAANLLFITLILFGLYGLSRLNTQFFPTVEVKLINITISWPGATAEDVDRNIVEVIQPELRFIDGVKELRTTARNNSATITVEFRRNVNMQTAKSDVEAAMGQITTLPLDAERPLIAQQVFYEDVASVLVAGDVSERTLKAYAKQIRDGLLNAGVDRINFEGLRDEEIWVEVDNEQLQRYDLSLASIASRIGASSLDVPGGVLRGKVEQQVRAVGLALSADDVGAIELRATRDGSRVLIRDVAEIRDTFSADQPTGWHGTERAIRLNIQRTKATDALEAAEIITNYIDEITPTLPSSIQVSVFDVSANKIWQRIKVLVGNGAGGMVLVLLILFLFLNARIAIWVAAGVPISIMATFGFMWVLGMSINMLSLFALIMTVGIIVDDAIVVGEHSATLAGQGDSPHDASERGAIRMTTPIIAATLTTLAAFLPMLVVDNQFGDIVRPIPFVLLAVLLASVMECFFILPGHLRFALARGLKPPRGYKKKFLDWFDHFRHHRFKNFVRASYDNHYTTLASGVAVFLMCVGLLAGGHLNFRFFPSPEGEVVNAFVFFQPGTSRETTQKEMRKIENALTGAMQELTGNSDNRDIVRTIFTQIGTTGRSRGDDRGVVYAELAPSEERDIRTSDILKAWEAALPPIADTRGVFIRERRGGPSGTDIDIQLSNASPDILKKASLELRSALEAFPGVGAVWDSLSYSREELVLKTNAYGSALGFDNRMVGQAARNSLEGVIAKRFARDDEEVTIRVLEPRSANRPRRLEDIELLVPQATRDGQSNAGRTVPLAALVDIETKYGFSSINRVDGKVLITVNAEYDPNAGNPNKVLQAMQEDILPRIVDKYNISYSFGGRTRDQNDTFSRLLIGAGMALAIIYLILAFVFASYGRPLVIMLVIPFGFIGTVIGHFVQGFDLTFLSLIGLLGLSGILVNNSIILINRIDERITGGEEQREAVIGGVVDRLRPVLLTSMTTVFGLAPLLFETSVQAQFLLPMVITIAWGLALASIIVLFLVPAALHVQEDIRGLFGRRSQSSDTKSAA